MTGSPDVAGIEDTCVGCNRSPLDVSLVLACNHRLCLTCAAANLRAVAPAGFSADASNEDCDFIAACPTCGTVTDVDLSAARHIQEYRAKVGQRIEGVPGQPLAPRLAQPAPIQVGATLCGQCEAEEAEVDCLQCGEQFCSRCASELHRAGRMKEHRLVARRRAGPRPGPGGSRTASPARPVLRGEEDTSGLSERCPIHPDEYLQFFCMDCETACMCAECAVEAARGGRDVVNARKAYQQLSKSIDKTIDGLQGRSEDSVRVRDQAEAVRTDLDKIIAQGKQSMQNAFRQLRADLTQKEAQLLSGLDGVESAAGRELAQRVAPLAVHTMALQEARSFLRMIDAREADASGPVQALNAFAAARATVSCLLDPQASVTGADLGFAIETVRSEVRGCIDQQVRNVATISDKVLEARRSSKDISVNARV